MKSFQAVILAAIVASSVAVNEPVSTAAMERELAEYERKLGTDVTAFPTETPGRSMSTSMSVAVESKSAKAKVSKTKTTKAAKAIEADAMSMSSSMSVPSKSMSAATGGVAAKTPKATVDVAAKTSKVVKAAKSFIATESSSLSMSSSMSV